MRWLSGRPAALVAAGTVLLAGVVAAAPSAHADPIAGVTPTFVQPGDQITVTGSGFGPCEESDVWVQVQWDDGRSLTEVPVSDGEFTAVVDVPVDATDNDHQLGLQCYYPQKEEAFGDVYPGGTVHVTHACTTSCPTLIAFQDGSDPSVTVSGRGFFSCREYTVIPVALQLLWDGKPFGELIPAVNSDGFFDPRSIPVPEGTTTASYTIGAECVDTDNGATSGVITQTGVTVTLPAPPPPPSTPDTTPVTTPVSSPVQTAAPAPQARRRHLTPVAFVAGGVGALALVVLLLLALPPTRSQVLRRVLGQRVRCAPGKPGRADTVVTEPADGDALSIGFEPRPDLVGTVTMKEREQ